MLYIRCILFAILSLMYIRLEIYCGKKQHLAQTPAVQKVDDLAGPTAVIRNLKKVLEDEQEDESWRIVVTDRFYTSVRLALALWDMKFYIVGTAMTNRLGFCKTVIDRRSKRPENVPRGEYKIAFSKENPLLIALSWMDSKPVHMLATGSSIEESTVVRRNRDGSVYHVPCPKPMLDYHRWMGGVDIHDQLRLQRYSIQLAIRFKKYCKSIFLGLVDMALVNAFIIYRFRKTKEKQRTSRDEFLSTLQNQLLSLQPQDLEMDQEEVAEMNAHESNLHHLEESPEFQIVGTRKKRRQRACKVCSLLRSNDTARSYNSKYYCPACSQGKKRIYLCDRVRRAESGNSLTCFQVWHFQWKSGLQLPANITKLIKMRPINNNTGRRRAREPSDDYM